MTRIFTLGETMALFETEAGPLEHARSARVSIGGAESNVAIALTRLGSRVTWLGRVGADPLGGRIRRELGAEGIDVVAITDSVAPTATMIKEHRLPGHARVLYYRAGSAGSNLAPSDLETADIASARAVHLTGITAAISDSAHRTAHAAIDQAAPSAIVSFDVNHRAALWRGRDPRATYAGLAARSSIVFAGIEEARLLTGTDGSPEELARRICELGPRTAVIKLGRDGAVAVADGRVHGAAAHSVPVVDTVGAGDAFVAGFLSELSRDRSTEESLTTANAAAAFACMSHGDWEGFPRRDELSQLTSSEPVIR